MCSRQICLPNRREKVVQICLPNRRKEVVLLNSTSEFQREALGRYVLKLTDKPSCWLHFSFVHPELTYNISVLFFFSFTPENIQPLQMKNIWVNHFVSKTKLIFIHYFIGQQVTDQF